MKPSVEQLVAYPELAILAVLEAAGRLAVVALAAAWPEVSNDEHPEHPEPRAALDIIEHARLLHAAINRYRLALAVTARREPELPF